MYKLKKGWHNKTVFHNTLGKVTFYKEADQKLLKLWFKFMPQVVTFTKVEEEKEEIYPNDTDQEVSI